jgi:hypothetical protein
VVSKVKTIERNLLAGIANEAHVGDWHDLRWFAIGGDNPRAIIVLKRGANGKRVKTISANLDPTAWESWKPVLADLQAERGKTNKRRVSHKKLQTGKI